MIEYIILGLVQGVTEFFPVSSSGHLVVLERVFGLAEQGVAISIVMHVGTLVSVLIFFFQDIIGALRDKRMVLFILVVTCITGVIGVLGKDFFESLFTSVRFVAMGWIATGLILLLTRRFMGQGRKTVTIKDAVILGATQGIAIIPGVSRSGVTISTLLYRGIDRMKGFTVSFLVSVPVIAGAAVLEAKKINFVVSGNPVPLAIGFFCSFAAGLFALWILKRAIARARFHFFAYYCFVCAIITLIWVK
ncbi:MAG: undecaprenyl-diphosphate phosphatase [Candidatus Omnitrophota bacterium]